MELQQLFYLVGIISMVGWLLVLMILVAVGYQFYRTTKRLETEITDKLKSPFTGLFLTALPILPTLMAVISRFRRRR